MSNSPNTPSDVIKHITSDNQLKVSFVPSNNPLPSAFCFDKKKINAFVLGADPSNFSDNGKTVFLKTVFGIGSGDNRYFRDILVNLKLIGLNLEDIYVQNLIQNFMDTETTDNELWSQFAEIWLPVLKAEFDKMDKKQKTPVLITAQKIFDFLLNKGEGEDKVENYYTDKKTKILVPKDNNRLNRPIVPFFRAPVYKLTKNRWPNYINKAKKIFI